MAFSLYYEEKGFGTPLILLHGNGGDSSFFKNQIDYFAARFRVITVDTRGHGRSPRGTKRFSLDTFADDLMALMTALGLKKADILGFSDGGNIAILFALKYPQAVNRLVLNGANLFPTGLAFPFLAASAAEYCAISLLAPFSQKAVKRKELLFLMVKEPKLTPEQLAEIKCPVLVIAGTHDLIREKHTKLIAASLPDAQLCFLKGGHDIAKTDSFNFNQAVERFLTE